MKKLASDRIDLLDRLNRNIDKSNSILITLMESEAAIQFKHIGGCISAASDYLEDSRRLSKQLEAID